MLYTDHYAYCFEHLYTRPWAAKHQVNLSTLERLLHCRSGVWLDTFCGQGWHFANTGSHMQKVGIDRSSAQLAIAQKNNPNCFFIKADLGKSLLKNSCADLITNFWGSYCYLADVESVINFFSSACTAVKSDGALYWELLQIEDLQTFNSSRFAEEAGARVQEISGFHWTYTDAGGRHEMISPSLDFFLEVASIYFAKVNHWHDQHFMTHLVCEHRY
ncbi:MAG: hypothetical protein CMP95_06570 [Gammaproteobacteria bacterium]|nr:hypothetical protein [Gammaproteobacteria bacterium]